MKLKSAAKNVLSMLVIAAIPIGLSAWNITYWVHQNIPIRYKVHGACLGTMGIFIGYTALFALFVTLVRSK